MSAASQEQATVADNQDAWVRARQLEGTWPGDPMTGVWPITYYRVLRGWGQIALYTRVWDAFDCYRAFERGSGVRACFKVTEKWKNPNEGRLDFDQSGGTILGGHSVAISRPTFCSPCPIDWSEDSCFVFNNTWGGTWGNHGWGAMTHDFFNREMYLAWSVEMSATFPRLFGSGIQHVEWNPGSFPDRRFFAYDIVDVDNHERLAWAIVVHRRGELHVEDLYVKPEYRKGGFGTQMLTRLIEIAAEVGQPLRFWISFADVEDETQFNVVRRWFESHDLHLSPSPRPWAAYCVTQHRTCADVPPVHLPPKPAFTFAGRAMSASVDWQRIQESYSVTPDFVDAAKDVFKRHEALLRRLA